MGDARKTARAPRRAHWTESCLSPDRVSIRVEPNRHTCAALERKRSFQANTMDDGKAHIAPNVRLSLNYYKYQESWGRLR
jgi:hypothetical protein